ncbi:hypothetical protein EYM_06270 [Ignicoccus islandicus DSM 13165]|uniref:Uncharacterized protein n=1 Tax=Ignicoccus islandicus DSM 13165 TaxID=940295 RepID=A0A0U3FQQ0_9CREN|nr:hypothetical protein [Ignicoccus islandicus]ALU12671.1 hypothetical protein EYM_06270 [Ignicoccus islandicus DSM 13165]
MIVDYASLACLVGSAIAATTSIVTLVKVNKAVKGLKQIYRKLDETEEAIEEVRSVVSRDRLSKKSALSLVEAARLLAEDARNLYEWSGEEKFLNVARKWEAFAELNRKAIEKILGYERDEMPASVTYNNEEAMVA